MIPIREWKEFELEEVSKHLIVVGELSGDCANCRHIGIDYLNQKNCPSCKTEFKYIAARNPKQSPSIYKKVKDKGLGLAVLEYADFKLGQDRKKAKELFK